MSSEIVLVTGANGYTGGRLSNFLARKGVQTRAMYWPPDGKPKFDHAEIEPVPGDLRDDESLKRALSAVDTVYNVAALYRPTNVSNRMYWEVNCEGVRRISKLAAEAGVRRFVQCSTIGVHGHVEHPPANEESPIKPDDYYQYTKYEGEKVALSVGQDSGMEVVAIRPAAIYGPLEERFLKVPKLIQRGRFIMFGSGDVLYHFIHIDDLCRAFVLAANRHEAVGKTYIIADDHAVTLNEIVSLISRELGVGRPSTRLPLFALNAASFVCEFTCKPFRVSPPLHRRRASWFSATRSFDISKARRELGFEPTIKPEEGLIDMVRSYRKAGWIM